MGWSSATRAAKARRMCEPDKGASPAARVALAAMARADEYAATTLTGALFTVAPPSPRRSTVPPVTPIRELLVMTVGDTCNLACRYCYEAARRGQGPDRRMRIETLRRILDNVLPYVRPPFLLAWHGGEPLLMGREFFEVALDLVRDVAGGDWVMMGLQTNATLLDAGWAELLRKHSVGVGVSLDGPPAAHDAQRVTPNGAGTYAQTLRGIGALRDAGVPFGTIAVIDAAHAATPGSAKALFEHFGELGIRSYDVHPSLTHTAAGRWANLSPADYSRFMIDLFERWIGEGDPDIRIGFFEHFFQGMTGQKSETCYLSGACASVLGVGPQGWAIPCTRPFDAAFTFGNLAERSLPDILRDPPFQRFKREEAAGRGDLRSCQWSSLCAAGCPHDRVRDDRQAIDGANVYCTCQTGAQGGYPAIFGHIRARIEAIVRA